MSKRDENLPEDNMKAVEHGLTVYQRTQAEVGRLTNELQEARARIAELEAKVQAMESNRNMVETTAERHKQERDEAVSHRAIYEAFFTSLSTSILAQFRAFNIPTKPLAERGSASLEALAGIADIVKTEFPRHTMPRLPGIKDGDGRAT